MLRKKNLCFFRVHSFSETHAVTFANGRHKAKTINKFCYELCACWLHTKNKEIRYYRHKIGISFLCNFLKSSLTLIIFVVFGLFASFSFQFVCNFHLYLFKRHYTYSSYFPHHCKSYCGVYSHRERWRNEQKKKAKKQKRMQKIMNHRTLCIRL